jgi:sugar diacid utilization regulator
MFSSESEPLRQTIALFDRLTAMALTGADVTEITDALSSWLGQVVVVFDPLLDIVAAASPDGGRKRDRPVAAQLNPLGWNLEDARLREAFETAAGKHLPLHLPSIPGTPFGAECVLAPICVGDELLGFLAVTRQPSTSGQDLDLLRVQHAASTYALVLFQAERDAELQARYRRELVEALLAGHLPHAKAAELAVVAGLIPDVPYWVVALSPTGNSATSGEPLPSILASLSKMLDARAPGTVAVPRSDHVTIFVPCLGEPGSAETRSLSSYGAGLKRLLAERHPGVSFAIGASSRVPDPSALAAADEQAQRALEVVRRLGVAGQITSYDELGVHRLLLHVPPEELRLFAEEVLGELVAYDRTRGASMTETLATYLRTGENLRRTAAEMILHVNTVSYRMRRVEAISGLDLSDPAQRLLARVALDIFHLFGPA